MERFLSLRHPTRDAKIKKERERKWRVGAPPGKESLRVSSSREKDEIESATARADATLFTVLTFKSARPGVNERVSLSSSSLSIHRGVHQPRRRERWVSARRVYCFYLFKFWRDADAERAYLLITIWSHVFARRLVVNFIGWHSTCSCIAASDASKSFHRRARVRVMLSKRKRVCITENQFLFCALQMWIIVIKGHSSFL
jgi:hypothetical protein